MQDEPYREIPLYNQAGVIVAHAMVDAQDYARLAQYRWCVDSKSYVYRHVYSGDNVDRPRRLHRDVMNVTDPTVTVDHIDQNTLDNRRANLRVGPQSLNQQNRRKQRGTSRYRGVTLYRNGKWMAQCQLNGKMHHLGYFDDEDEAGAAAAAFRAANLPWSADAREAREQRDAGRGAA